MSTMDERYEGHFLEAIDLPEGKLVPVTIEDVALPDTEKDSSGKTIRKAIIGFKGKGKRLILSKTNYRILKHVFGKDTSGWLAKETSLQRRYLDAKHGFGRENEMGIRFIPPVGMPIPKSIFEQMGSATPYATAV